MDRRRFTALIAGALGALAAPGAALAQPAGKVARVAYLSASAAAEAGPNRKAMMEGFRSLGWIEGRNLLIDERYADIILEIEKTKELSDAAIQKPFAPIGVLTPSQARSTGVSASM